MVEAIRRGDIPGVQIRCRRALPLAPEAAWAWLAEAGRLESWAGDRAQVEPADAGSLTLITEDEQGERLEEEARTLEIVPHRRWVLSFRRAGAGWTAATRLTLELRPLPQGCELSVLQHGFQHLPLSDCLTIWEFYRRRWRRALERLEEAVSAG